MIHPLQHRPAGLHTPQQQNRDIPWAARALAILQENSNKLDKVLPNNKLQNVLDNFYKKRLEPLLRNEKAKAFNDWLDDNGHGEWYKKLGSYLGKLPMRSLRDILSMLYNVIKAIVYGLVHPLKSLNKAVLFFVQLLEALKRPETYTSIGAGIAGAALGHCAVTGLYVPMALGVAIGGAFMAVGLSYDAIKTAVQVPKTFKEMLFKNMKLIPQTLLTGFLTGAVLGGVQKAFTATRAPTSAEVERFLGYRWRHRGYLEDFVYNPHDRSVVYSWHDFQKYIRHRTWSHLDRTVMPPIYTRTPDFTKAAQGVAAAVQLKPDLPPTSRLNFGRT